MVFILFVIHNLAYYPTVMQNPLRRDVRFRTESSAEGAERYPVRENGHLGARNGERAENSWLETDSNKDDERR